jgi:hypothetical protein
LIDPLSQVLGSIRLTGGVFLPSRLQAGIRHAAVGTAVVV